MGLKPMVEILLAKGADALRLVYDKYWNAFEAVARKGHTEILELLLERLDNIPQRVSHSILEHIKCVEVGK